MDFTAVLKRTWEITWKHKALWVLGILASCNPSGRGGSGSGGGGGGAGYQFDSGDLPFDTGTIDSFLRSIEGEILWIILGLFCLVVFLGLLFLALGVLGQGGLIASFGKADEGEHVNLASAFSDGLRYFWKLLGIRFTVWLAGILIGIVLVGGAILLTVLTLGIGLLALLPLLCLIIPIALAVDAYIALTMVAAVEQDVGVFKAFSYSWKTVRENFGSFLVMALILVIGGAILSFILAIPMILVVGPFIVGLLTGDEQGFLTGLAISGICLIALLPVVVFLQGVLTTFVTGGWTITYRRLTGKAGVEALPS